jgi:hypothetical protein
MPGGNIFGESFKDYVAKQINVRQQKLSISNKYDSNTLKFINNNTSWVRLSSGVNLSPDRASKLDANLPGSELAKQYVLYSARSNNKFTSGVGYDLSSTTYGFLSNPVYGLVPPPGIISAEIKPMNDKGTLRTATVQIECHNLPQFRVIEALYLRLKYSMLLEWGHTVWFDNESTLRTFSPDWVYQGFLNGSHNQDSIIDALEKARIQASGNYDGFFGWVRNFNWNLKPNGGYDVTLELISLGDTIESLKLNVNYPQASSEASPTAATEPETPKPPVIANKNKSAIHQILFAIKTELDLQGYLDGFNAGGRTSLQSDEIVRITKANSKYDLVKPNYKHPMEIWDKANGILTYQEGIKCRFDQLTTENDGTGGYFYYIKLGTLLRIIESFLLKYDTSKEVNGSYRPLFYIDHDFDTNICLTLPRQISTDPRICILPSAKGATAGEGSNNNQTKITTTYQKISFSKKEEEIGVSLDNIFGSNNTYLEQSPVESITGDDSSFQESQVITSYETIDEEQTDANGQTIKRPTKVKVILKDGKEKTYFISDSSIPTFYLDSTTINENNKVLTKDETTGEVTVTQNANNTSGLGNYFRVGGDEYAFLGKFMHIHVNLDFISTVLSDNIDENGKISIYAFLEQTMQGIQDVTGNINDYRILYDELTNYFYIADNSTLPNGDKLFGKTSTPTVINAHVLTNTMGSFVTNVSLKSELNNNYATMISVGAQSNGNVVGEDATAFSRWNEGYTDRIITDRSSVIDETTQESGSKSPEQVFQDNLVKYGELNNAINNGQVTTNDISNSGQAVVDMLKYEIAYFTQQNCIQGQGFLPINLQLTMLGLSGPRLFESYTIDETLLPDNYKNNIKFLTKGITHKIDSNGWTTTLDSFSGPKLSSLNKPIFYWPPEAPPPAAVATGDGNSNGNSAGGGGGGSTASSIDGCPPLPNVLNEEIVTSKIVPNAYGGYIKGKKSFIAKVESAYQTLAAQGINLSIGDSIRNFDFQKQQYEKYKRGERSGPVASPCKGYHVRGQAIDLNQTSTQGKNVKSYGSIYQALYNAGLRRIDSEWWHWSLGETDHTFDKKFSNSSG